MKMKSASPKNEDKRQMQHTLDMFNDSKRYKKSDHISKKDN